MTSKHKLSAPFPSSCGITGFKKHTRSLCIGHVIAVIMCCFANVAFADQFGDFTYVDNGATVTITDYPTTATGAVVIPETILDPISGLQDTVTDIGFEAFRDCTLLTSVTIPSNVTNIGGNAFYNCAGLTSISIPATVTSIGSGAFSICTSLASISIDDANPNYSSSPDGVFFNKAKSTLITFPAGKSGGYSVPVGVTLIGFEAFRNCARITSVSIPSSTTIISNNAFYSCSGLTSVSISSGVTGLTLGTYAFYNCQLLTGIVLPLGVTTIGTNAFYFCKGMTSITIPTSVTSIGAGAFYNCSGLKSVVLPSSITSISAATFYSCSGLESVTIPSTVTSIGLDGFRYCSGLTSVTLPPNLVSLGTRAFAGCRGLTSISIPASVTSIGTDAFNVCSSLTSISVAGANPNFSSSPDGVLFNKAKSTLIAFPAGKSGGYSVPAEVTSIGAKAFHTCEKLVGVTLPESLLTIGTDAFSYCSSLKYALFKGEAPLVFSNIFLLAASGFTVHYFDTATEFTTPTWTIFDYPASSMGGGGTLTEEANWLLDHGLPANMALDADPNGDGVNLLMAYGLGLDPQQNLATSMPQPVFGANEMSLSFYAGNPAVSYAVVTCENLTGWTTEGVQLSAPDANQIRTATVPMSSPRRFLRLEIRK